MATTNINITGNFAKGIFAQTANSPAVTASTTESTILDGGEGSLTVPVNGFAVGDSFMLTIGGHISTANNQTLHIRIKSGSVILADTGALSMAQVTNRHWNLEIRFTIRAIGAAGVAAIASFGTFTYSKNANQFEGTDFSIVNTTTFDTTISNTLDVTAEWGSNNASNTIYSESAILTKIF